MPSQITTSTTITSRTHPTTSCFRTLTEQSRIHDLVGTEGTEVVNDDPPSAEEKQRVQELADRLNK